MFFLVVLLCNYVMIIFRFHIAHILYILLFGLFKSLEVINGKIDIKYYWNQLGRIVLEEYISMYVEVSLYQRPMQPFV